MKALSRTIQASGATSLQAGQQPRGSAKAPNARLQQLLHRMKAVQVAEAAIIETPTETPADAVDMTFVTEDEASSLSASQLSFLVRKRKAAAGLGPIMPEESMCPCCSGHGTRECHQCHGTGHNAEGKVASMYGAEDEVRILNGLVDAQWFLMDNGPCWLCKGLAHVACSDCSGTGIRGGVDRYTGD